MNETWQSIAAIAVVLITVVLFTVRAAKRRKKPGCGGGCGCVRNVPKVLDERQDH